MNEIERIKRRMQEIVASQEALTTKRVRACVLLESLLHHLAFMLPDEQRMSITDVLELHSRLWSRSDVKS